LLQLIPVNAVDAPIQRAVFIEKALRKEKRYRIRLENVYSAQTSFLGNNTKTDDLVERCSLLKKASSNAIEEL
jgi:hypothetical protein